jgi:CxxC-x17-CxxC domain-containing protein
MMATKQGTATADVEADRTATCLDCGAPFVVIAAEQVWYRDHARPEPERCPLCRERRRAERNAPLLAAHQAEESSAAERGVTVYGGPGQRHSAAPPPRQLYPAVCHSCGKETEVPFIPRGNRPVYCRDCFSQRRGRR